VEAQSQVAAGEKKEEDGRPAGAGSAMSAASKKEGKQESAGSKASLAKKPSQMSGVQSFAAKRQMDQVFLNKQTREFKEKLLDYVDEIVVRQNASDPVANMESFTTENASRKVLKELLNEFHVTAEDLRKKSAVHEEKLRAQKALGEKQQLLMKKL
jgi:hypothetical protein